MHRDRLQLEPLEPRRLLSGGTLTLAGVNTQVDTYHMQGGTFAFTVGTDGTLTLVAADADVTSKGTLVIKGGENADGISVVRDGNLIKYTVATAGGGNAVTSIVSASKVKRVLVEAGGGNDRVFVDDELAKPCTVAGGGGNDVIEGNRGATLIGGAGNDRLSVPPVDATLTVIEAQALQNTWTVISPRPSLLSGGAGNDVLVATAADVVVGGRGNDTAVLVMRGRPGPDAIDPAAEFGANASGIETFDALFPDGVPAVPIVPVAPPVPTTPVDQPDGADDEDEKSWFVP
jgi:Ca2+-binding RTX toxin-like protein